MGRICGGHFRMRRGHILPVIGMHVRRFRPLAVGLPGVHGIFPCLSLQAQRPCHKTRLPAASHHELRITLHTVIVFRQNPPVPVHFPETIGVQYPNIGPAHTAVHGPHIEVSAPVGRDLGKPAILFLPVEHIPQILFGEGGIVKEIIGRLEENLGVPRPAMALPGGAVRGDVQGIAFRRPDDRIHETIQQFIGALKVSCLLQIRVHGNGRYIFRLQDEIRFHFRIPKTKYGKSRLVCIVALLADIFYLLKRSGDLFIAALDIFLGQISVLIQQLPETEQQPLSFFRLDAERNVSCDVLSEVQQHPAVWRFRKDRCKMLPLRHRHIIGCTGQNLMGRRLCPAAICRCSESLHDLPVLVVRKTDGAVIGPAPGLVCKDLFGASVSIQNFQLGKEFGLCPILISDSPGPDAPPVPAVRKLHCQGMISLFQQPGHIIRLVLHSFIVIRIAGRKAEIADFTSVQPRLIKPAGRNVQPGRLHFLGDLHLFQEAIYWIALLPVHPIIACDPFCAPVHGFQQTHFKECLFGPVPRPIVFIPQFDLPEHALAGGKHMGKPDPCHSGRGCLTAVPYGFALCLRQDAIGCLPYRAFHVPH